MASRQTQTVLVGGVPLGGGRPVTVQSMLSVPASDVRGNVEQAKALEQAGCDIVRVAVPDASAVRLVAALKEAVSIPVVADIHFDYKLALESAAAGVDKIRINPGNIGGDDRVKAVADACRLRGIPIRIGVNAGSLEKDILARYGHPTAEALRDSALYHASLLEKFDFHDIVLSLKSSDVPTMVRAYELTAEACRYPLHLGVTEAGTERMGLIKSAAGIGSLLLHGIGDTIRVSLTADPVREVAAGLDHAPGPGPEAEPAHSGILSHLRADQHRSHPHRLRGGGAAAGGGQAADRGGHGLRGQRPGRGPGGGYRHRRGQGEGSPLQKRGNSPHGGGRPHRRGTDGGNRADVKRGGLERKGVKA